MEERFVSCLAVVEKFAIYRLHFSFDRRIENGQGKEIFLAVFSEWYVTGGRFLDSVHSFRRFVENFSLTVNTQLCVYLQPAYIRLRLKVLYVEII